MLPNERYMRDPVFHALVDRLYEAIAGAQFTPTELREAVILAATKYEMTHVRDFTGNPLHHTPQEPRTGESEG